MKYILEEVLSSYCVFKPAPSAACEHESTTAFSTMTEEMHVGKQRSWILQISQNLKLDHCWNGVRRKASDFNDPRENTNKTRILASSEVSLLKSLIHSNHTTKCWRTNKTIKTALFAKAYWIVSRALKNKNPECQIIAEQSFTFWITVDCFNERSFSKQQSRTFIFIIFTESENTSHSDGVSWLRKK